MGDSSVSNNLKIMKKILMKPEKFRDTNYAGKACFSYNYMQYGSLENWPIALNILNNLPPNENICNELILESSKVKAYFDIEWLKNDFPDLKAFMVREEITEGLVNVYKKEFDIVLNRDDIHFATCHREKTDGFKYSFHIVVSTHPAIVFLNATYVAYIAKELKTFCTFDKSIIDMSVYKRTQNIRLVGHCKYGEFKKPFMPDEGVDPIEYIITNIDREHILIDSIPEQRDYLYKDIKCIKKLDLATDTNAMHEIVEKIKIYHPTVKYDKTDASGFHQFNYSDRSEPCFSNGVNLHDKIGFYAYIDNNNLICLGCHSGNCVDSNNKKIIKILGSKGVDKNLTFEKVDYENTFDIDHCFIESCVNDGAIGISNLFQKMYLTPKRIKWIDDVKNGISYFWNGKLWEEDNYLFLDRLLVLTVVRVLRNFIKTFNNKKKENDPVSISEDSGSAADNASKIVARLNDGNIIFSVLKFVKPLIRDVHFSKIKDIHPHFLSCKNGLIDLFTGEIRAAVPDDNITKSIDICYDTNSDSSDFELFVRQITSTELGGNDEMYDYLKWFIGYAMQGNPKKKMFIILYGEKGFNGKSLLMNTISDILEYYAVSMDKSVVLESQKKTAGAHSTEICQLENCRFGILSDTKEDAAIDDGQMKQLTGITDKLSVREIFGKQKEFIPTFVPFISTNHTIQVNLSDKAMYERLILMPFNLSFVDEPKLSYEKKNDPSLAEKFKKNKAGILKWLVEASIYYNSNQEKPVPQCIKDAKDIYNKQVNNYLDFIGKNFIEVADEMISKTELIQMFKEYGKENNIKTTTKAAEKEFDQMFKFKNIKNKKHYIGIKYNDENSVEYESGSDTGLDETQFLL